MGRGDKTTQVKEAAKYLGLSERTIWRRLAAQPDRQDDEYVVDDLIDSIEERTCGFCGEPLPITASARIEYCDDICRQYARRRRLAHEAFAAALAARAKSARDRA
jgi:hypothetical protein